MTKRTLRLGTLACLYMSVCVPHLAMAQTAPTESWNIGPVTTGTTNTGASTLYGSMDTPTISGATVRGASISGAAVGASSSVSASLVTDGTATPASVANYNTVTLVTTNGSAATASEAETDGVVSVYGDLDTPQIAAGIANSVSLAAVGASGSLSVSSLSSDISASTQEVTFDQAVNVTTTNYGSVIVGGGRNNNVAVDEANIAAGLNNSISVAGVGASSSASVDVVANGGSTPAETINLGTQSDGTDPVAVNLTATDGEFEKTETNGDVTVTADVTSGTIDYGIGNSISVAAVGASTSLGVSSLADGAGTAPTTDVNVGTATLQATNNGPVTVNGQLDSPYIADGVGNSVSIAAVGASASASIDSVAFGSAAPSMTVDTGVLSISANNTGDVTNNGSINIDAAVAGGSAPYYIDGGIGNGISLAAVGASGSLGVNNLSSGDSSTAPSNVVTVGESTIGATNSGAVTMADNGGIALAYIDSTATTPTINASISAAAVGASTSVSTSTISNAGASPVGSVSIGNTALTSTNTGVVSANGNIDQPEIVDGTSGSISVAAVGASSSASFSTIQWDGGQNNTNVTSGTVGLTATNSTGAVSATSNIIESGITGGIGNSISVAAVGASTSLSVSNVSVGDDGGTPAYSGGAAETTVGAATLSSTNSSTVTTTGYLGAMGWDVADDLAEYSNPSISGGSLGSISVAAVGASGSTSYGSTTATGGLGSQAYSLASANMTISNSGGVTVNSNIYGANISGGLNNSISMAAVGASASSSLNLIAR